MNLKYLFIALISIISCKPENHKLDLAKKFYLKIKSENIEKLLSLEFGTRGDFELWTYYFDLYYDSTYIWQYSLRNDSFDLTTHPNYRQFKKEVSDPLRFVKNIEDEKNSLGIVAISNSPWPGHFVKFWFSGSDVLIYQPGDFKIDSDPKKRWLDELNKGTRLDSNWVYLDMNKND